VPSVYTGTRDVPLADLTPFPGNARRGDVDQIRASLRRHGQYRSLIVRDTGDALVVLAGNHTLQALHGEHADTARCEIITCTDDEALRINVADNRLGQLGGYDDEALTELLLGLAGDFEGTGYNLDDLSALLPWPEPVTADPDDVPDLPEDPTSTVGDLWLLGEHRLLVGDSSDPSAAKTVMDGALADAMWTDPPYGVEYVGKTKDALTISNDGADGLSGLLTAAFGAAAAVLKPAAPLYIAHADTMRVTVEQAMESAGFISKQNLVWVKDVLVLGRSDYHWRHEPILYGRAAGGTGRQGRGSASWYGDNRQTTVFEVPKPARSTEHPTMKPVELIVRMLTNSVPPAGLVFEPFAGSGSTLIAAHNTGRTCRAIELDPRYADVICRRFAQHTGTVPTNAATGEPFPLSA
jgi:DNA modification methylase